MRWQSSRWTRATGTKNFIATWAVIAPLAYLLLHAFRKLIDQRQPARYPTQAAIKAARQLVETIAETLLQFGQQPAFFQSAVSCSTSAASDPTPELRLRS